MTDRQGDRIGVGVLGATGTVGSLLVRMLADHPWFRLDEVGSSPSSEGFRLGERTAPDVTDHLPDRAANLVLKPLASEWTSPLLLSALPASVAREIEPALAGRGHVVVSNASAFRQDADVPLVIPEVNPGHLTLIERQAGRWPGAIITNPNCVTAGLALALAPLHRTFGLDRCVVSTFQAISGAGRPGPSAGDLVDNVLPHIPGEEEKIAQESQKILGSVTGGTLAPGDFAVSAHANRVPVLHGHFMTVSAALRAPAPPDAVRGAFEDFRSPEPTLGLPSAPARALELMRQDARPQPRLDRDRGRGMTVTVGRVRACPVLHVRFVVLVHNLVRGAAGAALLNAELAHASGVAARASTS